MPTTIRLKPDIEQRLDFLASETGRSKAFYLRQIIEDNLTDLEDYYLASNVLEQVRQGKEDVLSDEDVRKDLGLED
ncbi:type II toxin-antitoxin system RelB family antitoxin [Commensalibacter communis]|uniref:type II toxin-antitoxin system RelB family antitoxin n=1 Tax=Commensalibacter communis TaxID=2972786 RepID=UPI0022FF89FB|nr:TraY domain-containing protein [Commensalibacter communis]CAI3960744.1 Predicted DNA-binding protein with an HTH domain [Commensalibacter communis]CAI3960981.1 Predicted DNA-binding protein with an HTH domain [Commensalibacter communis]